MNQEIKVVLKIYVKYTESFFGSFKINLASKILLKVMIMKK